MVRRKEWINSRCPQCGQFGEDSPHAVLCRATDVFKVFSEAILTLRDNLEKINTHLLILNTITLTLMGGKHTFFCNMIEIDNDYKSDVLQGTMVVATLKQDNIGWHNFVEGKISRKWEIAQEMLYRLDKKCKRTGSRWAQILVSNLHDIIWKIWRHRNNTIHKKQSTIASKKKEEKSMMISTTNLNLVVMTYAPRIRNLLTFQRRK